VDYTGTVVGGHPHHGGQFPCTGPCFLVHKPSSDKPENPLLFPFLIIWMGYEHFHEIWDLAWPWLNLGNALATAPKLIQWVEYTGIRGGTLWIILTNFAIFKMVDTYRKRGLRSIIPMGVVTVLLAIIPVLISYQIFNNFREEGETVTVALVQPNLDPYTEKLRAGKGGSTLR